MTKREFEEFVQNHIVYLDGATGSNLVKAGMPSGVCPEEWILKNRDVMLSLQKAYVKAGTNILYAPTFTANRIKLSEYHLENQMKSMINDLVGISKEAAASSTRQKVYVAGDLTMTGEQLKPMGRLELEDLIDIYKEQILCMEEAGVDLLVVETMMSLAETRAALIAAKEVCDLPIMASFTFEKSGRTLYGTDPVTAAVVVQSLGACAVGANCSTGPAHMKQMISDMASACSIPIIAKPNAGLPFLNEEGGTAYDMDADTFVKEMEELVEAGATLLGGCCGTTPEFIEKLHEKFGETSGKDVQRRPEGTGYLASERMTVSFSQGDKFIIVGERINPTGKKLLQAQLREGSMDKVIQFAQEQEECGAQVLDVNMGMSGIDEKGMMLKVIEELGSATNLPLSLDSSYVEVLEAALRHYPGRALVNSVSLETEKFEKLLPIVAKYGAMFILLLLSDKGLPENIEEKRQIIEKISQRAFELGMRKEDIVVDGLVTTVGANKQAGLEALETIHYCREQGFATICGLSNISFGMPERNFVNTAFLTLAIKEGLTMAIANPSQELLVSCALAADLLLAKEEADLRYIEYAGMVKEKREQKETALVKQLERANSLGADAGGTSINRQDLSGQSEQTPADESPAHTDTKNAASQYHESLSDAVLKGNRGGIAEITRQALAAGEEPSALLNEALLPAINIVGDYFDKGKYFLPQLIASAETMKNYIEGLESLLFQETHGKEMPEVVIATVEGDIHDIGKNLVALMLKNYGFQVIDLGKDVPKEQIIAAAKEHNAQIIALSALMTTTMQRMREVIALAKEEHLDTKIMVGGAVITQEYAEEIGADGYSTDAADAVKLAQKLRQ